jgi:hypothetical protein
MTGRQERHFDAEKERLEITSDSELMRRILDTWIDGGLGEVSPAVSEADEQPTTYADTKITGGTRMVRLWVITCEKLDLIRQRHPHLSRVALIDQLASAPPEILDRIITGDYAPTPTPQITIAPLPIPLPESGADRLDQFLTRHCAQGIGLTCSMDAFYSSYEHFCDSDLDERRRDIWDRLNDRGFVVSLPTSTIMGMGLRKTAFAVLSGQATGYDVVE